MPKFDVDAGMWCEEERYEAEIIGLSDFHKPHASVGMSDWGPSLTRQEFADECDINQIMLRFEKGDVPGFEPRVPMYVDLTVLPADLQSSLAVLDAAQASFMSLPASVRREFDNDPHLFVAFAQDPGNLEQMRTWGLSPPDQVPPAPIRVIVEPTIVEAPQEPPKPV